MSILLVVSTFPDMPTARQIGTILVSQQLAACVNLLPSAESIYIWEDEVKQEPEVIGIIKTTKERYPELQEKLNELHPYDVPEIVAISPEDGLPEYLNWVESQTSLKGP